MNQNISFVDNFYAIVKRFGSNFINIHRVVKNWWAVFLFKYGIVKKVQFKTYTGKAFNIENLEDYKKFWKEPSIYLSNNYKILKRNNRLVVEFGEDSKYYRRNKVSLLYDDDDISSDVIRQIRDILYNKEYHFVNPDKKVIVDIGANMGDTAIYFNLRGAKKIYAVEAMPRLYKLMTLNLKINRINNVVPICAVCTNARKKYKLSKSSAWAGDIQEASDGYNLVNTISLKQIVKKYSIKGAILKIDCEGSEYDLIKNTEPDVLRKFDEIIIEYHYGYEDLVNRLKSCGFKVQHTRPTKAINEDLLKPIMYAGFVVAQRDARWD